MVGGMSTNVHVGYIDGLPNGHVDMIFFSFLVILQQQMTPNKFSDQVSTCTCLIMPKLRLISNSVHHLLNIRILLG